MDYIEKANYDLAAIQPGGRVVREQSANFLERLIIESKLLQLIPTKLMDRPEFEQPSIGFDNQVLFPDDEFVETPEADRATAVHDKRELSVKRFKVVAKVGYHTLAEVIEGGKPFDQFIIPLLAKKAKADMEKCVIQGDTTLPATTAENRMLRRVDGLLKQATSHIYDANGQKLSPAVLDEMDIMMPDQFSSVESMATFTSRKAAILYRQTKAARPTPGGDAQLIKKAFDDHHGMPIIDVPLMPSELGVNSDLSVALRTWPENILFGMQDNMTIKTKDEPDAGYVLVVLRYAFDVTYLDPNGVVKAINVKAKA